MLAAVFSQGGRRRLFCMPLRRAGVARPLSWCKLASVFRVLARRTPDPGKPPTDKTADDGAKNLLKSVNIQQEMLKIWQKLNVV